MKTAIVLVITIALAAGPLYSETAEQPPPTPAQEQPEVLTRGPVHEAFAEPVDINIQPDLIAPAEPPANIVENVPAEKPAGQQFVWVPGYWAWDADRNSYIWVSGCWRAAPLNRYWVPGYWSKTDNGWLWVPGFWALVGNVQQVVYLPAPPAITDVQPPGPPPTPDNIWVPPCWYWHQDSYIWRPGYWLVANAGWVWAPSHYVWTPRGYVFVAGHWDYPLASRGILFAPVYIPERVYRRPGFSLSLGVVVDLGWLELNLFTYPRYCHYYFGDYYDNAYIKIGIYPRFECRNRWTWYDPIYEHHRWRRHKIDSRWDEHERHEYDRRREDRDLRPPRTYREMEQRQDKLPEARRGDVQIARPLNRVIADKKAPLKFEPIRNDAKQKLNREVAEVHKFTEERSRWESASANPRPVQKPLEHRGLTKQPAERRDRDSVITPAVPRESTKPLPERKGPATQPAERRDREPVILPAPPKKSTMPSSEQTLQAPRSIERSVNAARNRETDVTKPERVKIPSPPIVGRRSGWGIFRKNPPSQPANEQKTEVRNTPRGSDATQDKDSPRNNDSPQGGSRRGRARDKSD